MILKRHAKKIFTGLFALVLAFVMTGCGSNPLLKAYQDALAAANTTLAEAKNLVAIPNADAITTDLVLPTQVVRDDWIVNVSWASSNPAVVATNGVVSRPTTADTDVTLTATLNYFYNYGGEDTPSATVKVADTKVFTITVVKAPVAPTPITVAAALASPNATSPDSDNVLVQGTVVAVNIDDGFFLNDGTAVIYVYSSSTVEVGDEVQVNAHKMVAYNLPQLALKTASSSKQTTNVTILSHDNPVYFHPMITDMSVGKFAALHAGDDNTYGKAIRLYGKVVADVISDTRTDYYLEDPFTGYQVQFYYKSNDILNIVDYVDEYINVVLFIKGEYEKNQVPWAFTYSESPNSIELAMAPSDANYVAYALENVEIQDSMMAVQSITLPATMGAVAFTYALPAGESNASLNVNVLTAGDVSAATTVDLTVTATKGNVSYSMVKEIAISTLANTLTIAQFAALTNDAIDYIKGDIVGVGGVDGNNYFWIRDTAGDYLKVNDPLGTSVLGDKVVLQAQKKATDTGGTYADNITLIGTVSQGNPAIADPVGADVYADYNALLAMNSTPSIVGDYIKVTATIRKSGAYYNLYPDALSTTSKIYISDASPTITPLLYNYEDQEVDVYAFVSYFSAVTSANINLSIQKIVNNNPPVLVSSVEIQSTSDAVVVGDVNIPVQLSAVLNGGLLPRPTNRDMVWSVVSGAEFINFNPTTLVVSGVAVGTAQLKVVTDDGAFEDTIDLTIRAPQAGDIIDTVNFDSADYLKTTVYNNPEAAYFGPTSEQWATYYGTVSSTGFISGDQSMQMRWYSTNNQGGNLGYAEMQYEVLGASSVSFKAYTDGGLSVKVRYWSGTEWVDGQTFGSLGTSAALATTHTYTLPTELSGAKLKFVVVLPDPLPASGKRLVIDDVKFIY